MIFYFPVALTEYFQFDTVARLARQLEKKQVEPVMLPTRKQVVVDRFDQVNRYEYRFALLVIDAGLQLQNFIKTQFALAEVTGSKKQPQALAHHSGVHSLENGNQLFLFSAPSLRRQLSTFAGGGLVALLKAINQPPAQLPVEFVQRVTDQDAPFQVCPL